MEVITELEFQEIIYSDNTETISDIIVKINTPLNIDLKKVNLLITFSNVKFTGKQIRFYKTKKECLHRFIFEECIFESNILIESDFEDITFISNTFNCDKFHIHNSTICTFEFSNNESNKPNILKKGNFKIHKCNFDFEFLLKNVEFMKDTSFDISSVNFFDECHFTFISLDQVIFYNCTFSKTFMYDVDYSVSQFTECSFLGLATFSGLPDVNSSFLWFENCHFVKLANFNNYWLHKLRIEETTFSDNVSFQQTFFDTICFVRSIFEKKVWFDDIRIKKIEDCDRITIRTIKQELQKAENRIDFNLFRAHELRAYYKELKIELKKIKWKLLRKQWWNITADISILFITKHSTSFGISWTKAFTFTILSGLLWYSILYRIENSGSLNFERTNEFFVGAFRFFLVTDFYNPLENDRTYLEYGWSWLIFILGKIFIAFGIYEMIQSFRKFKA